jgi:KDO2-lipid IV(A) lauroyltransferase
MTSVLYYLLFGFTWIGSLIPFWLLYRISDVLFLFIYYIAGYRKETVYSNLRSSFPEKSQKEIIQLARAFFRHFCDFLLETTKAIRIPVDELDKRMKFLNPEVFQELTMNNQNFALVSSHYSNWEWLINVPLKMAHNLLVIYRPLKSKVVDRLSLYMRRRHKIIMIPMEGIYREALKHRSANQLFSVWFLADQRPPGNSRFWTKFLNHETAFFEGVEKMSRKLELALVFMDVQKVSRGYYEVTLKKLFDNTALTHENEVTLACVREIEDEILKRPEFWLWSHKRFKHSRPEHINLITS